MGLFSKIKDLFKKDEVKIEEVNNNYEEIEIDIKENSQCPKCENGKMILTELIAVD